MSRDQNRSSKFDSISLTSLPVFYEMLFCFMLLEPNLSKWYLFDTLDIV